MSFKEAIKHLRAAEQELLDQISATDCANDYGTRYDCLEYSKQVNELAAVLETYVSDTKLRKTESAVRRTQRPSVDLASAGDAQDNSLPAYFFYQDKLWKIASRGKDTDSLYCKSVPLEDVRCIIEGVAEMLLRQDIITIASVESVLTGKLPLYKSQITVMALVNRGVLKAVGRGKYSASGKGTISARAFMNTLKRSPVRTDLIRRAGVEA